MEDNVTLGVAGNFISLIVNEVQTRGFEELKDDEDKGFPDYVSVNLVDKTYTLYTPFGYMMAKNNKKLDGYKYYESGYDLFTHIVEYFENQPSSAHTAEKGTEVVAETTAPKKTSRKKKTEAKTDTNND